MLLTSMHTYVLTQVYRNISRKDNRYSDKNPMSVVKPFHKI